MARCPFHRRKFPPKKRLATRRVGNKCSKVAFTYSSKMKIKDSDKPKRGTKPFRKDGISENKTHRVEFLLSSKELKRLKELAKEYRFKSTAAFIRHIVLEREIPVAVYSKSDQHKINAIEQMTEQINKIGVNVNQLTRHIHTYPEHSEIMSVYRSVQALFNRLISEISEIK